MMLNNCLSLVNSVVLYIPNIFFFCYQALYQENALGFVGTVRDCLDKETMILEVLRVCFFGGFCVCVCSWYRRRCISSICSKDFYILAKKCINLWNLPHLRKVKKEMVSYVYKFI